MRINTNISALNAHRQLMTNTEMGSRAMEKLSSGLRINRAGDDAAGLAISEKMRGQIRGLHQASRNAQDGISLIQTAEGALSEIQTILQKMRELATQSASDTNTGDDRKEIQKEINQLAQEISRIAAQTEFNTQKLLDGTLEDMAFHIGANKGQNVKLSIGEMSAKELEVQGKVCIATAVKLTESDTIPGLQVRSLTGKELTIEFAALQDKDGKGVAKTTAGLSADGKTITVSLAQEEGDGTDPGVINATHGDVKAALESVAAEAGIEVLEGTGFNGTTNLNETTKPVSTSVSKQLNEGASELVGIYVSSQSAADEAIETLDKAIVNVSAERSMLGAYQNRLEHTIANLGTSAENLQAAESRIRDVDMAAQIMEFTKANILNQAATAMLAQANIAPQTVLQLLG